MPFSAHSLNPPFKSCLWIVFQGAPSEKSGIDGFKHCICSFSTSCLDSAVLRSSRGDSEVWAWLVISVHTTHKHMTSFSTLLLSYATANLNDPKLNASLHQARKTTAHKFPILFLLPLLK